jgi:hypothetical protein
VLVRRSTLEDVFLQADRPEADRLMTALTRLCATRRSRDHRLPPHWRGTVISCFVNPVFFLAAMGAGLGRWSTGDRPATLDPYLTFVATGLMAATAMQNGAGDGSFPVMAGIKWRKNFHAIITTADHPADIIIGTV